MSKKLHLLASDFKDCNYGHSEDCAISRAYKRQFKVKFASEFVSELDVSHPNPIIRLFKKTKTYIHQDYYRSMFDKDLEYAKLEDFDDQLIIRTIELI